MKRHEKSIKLGTWKVLTAAAFSPITEFTVDDFPTPPFPITSTVNELTSYGSLLHIRN